MNRRQSFLFHKFPTLLSLSQAYVSAQLKLHDVIKSGLLKIAQSKYSGQRIGPHNYYLEPHQSMQVVKVTSKTALEFSIAQRQEATGEGSEGDESDDDLDWPSPSASSNNLGIQGLTLKPRPKKGSRSIGKQDPLTWFGGLPPRSLKEAKGSFEEALKIIAEIATAKEGLQSMLRQG